MEWAPRECNREADLLANGITDLFDPERRLPVSAQTLVWNVLPDALSVGREAERAFRRMKESHGLPNRAQKQRKRKVETRLKVTDPGAMMNKGPSIFPLSLVPAFPHYLHWLPYWGSRIYWDYYFGMLYCFQRYFG